MPLILCVIASIWVAGANERLESASRVDGLGINMMGCQWWWNVFHDCYPGSGASSDVKWVCNNEVESARRYNNNNKGHARERECGFHASLYQKTNNVILSCRIIFIQTHTYMCGYIFIPGHMLLRHFFHSAWGDSRNRAYQIGECDDRQTKELYSSYNELIQIAKIILLYAHKITSYRIPQN